jgi:hypothetical protein
MRNAPPTTTLACAALCAFAAAGCGGGDDTASPDAGIRKDTLYVIANEIYTDSDSTTYVNVVDTLDAPVIDPAKALEFGGGRATVRAFDGRLFVAPPNSTVIKRYAVGDDGSLREDGEVGFGNLGVDRVVIDEWGNTFISPTKAYLFNPAQGETLIWNPSTMEIVGTVDQGGLDLIRDGFSLDTSPGVVRGNRLFRAFSWNNWDTYDWSDDNVLAVYDVETDKLVASITDTRCPALGNRVDKDEAGNLYFSNWIWNVGATLVYDAPESCVLRVNAGAETFDADWTLRYSAIAESRQGAMFANLGAGRALMSVFHDERVVIDDKTVGPELVSTPNWRLWTIDVEARTGAPLDGLEWNTGAISTYHVNGRSFVFVPGADWSVTQVHEIKDGRATHNFDLQGWSYQFFQIR